MRNDKRPSSDFLLVTLGLLTGFFLGAGIVYWYSNQPSDALITDQVLERISRLFQFSDDDNQTKETGAESGAEPQNKGAARAQLKESDNSATATLLLDTDSLGYDPMSGIADSLDLLDISDLYNEQDSMLSVREDSLLAGEASPISRQDEIRLERDRLIGVKGYSVALSREQTPDSQSSRKLDSLIGGNSSAQDNFRIFYIEFWESPLNYAAYRMGSNRIVLYGIDQVDEVGVSMIGNMLFIKYFENYFGLSPSANFKPLIPVSNAELLHKLEQIWP